MNTSTNIQQITTNIPIILTSLNLDGSSRIDCFAIFCGAIANISPIIPMTIIDIAIMISPPKKYLLSRV